jgi:UPF0755 protein
MTKKGRPAKPRKAKRLIAPVAGLLSGLFLLFLAVLLGVYAQAFGPGPVARDNAEVTSVSLKQGMGVIAIAKTLKEAGVIRSETAFRLAAKVSGRDNAMRAGTYEFDSRQPLFSVLKQIQDGKVVQHFVTIPEGRTSAQAVRILMAVEALKGDVDIPPEGSVLPETYQYEPGETRQAVLDRMLDAGRKTLNDLWAKRQPGLPINTPEEALILASVVEKETGIATERPRVAAVFVNRLRKGMRLESDPTVVYGVSKGEPLGRGLRRSELDTATPWNTYLISRLPITPIANPGKASIEAVLNPAQTNDIFFVADGTGGHVFAETYDQHLVNVANWRKIENQPRDSAVTALSSKAN